MEQLKERQWEEEEEEVMGLEKRLYRHGKNETTNLLGSRSSSGSSSVGNVRSESTITDIGSGSSDVGEFTRKNESSNDKEEDSVLQGGAGRNNVHFDTVEGLSFFNTDEKESKHFKDSNDETKQEAVVEITEENNREILELDVERVLEKQDTHDLYCPNCNSCITRKVILSRKKPRVPNVRRKDREPDVFRFLSCFSLFIPSGSCFKLFKSLRNSNEEGNVDQNALASTLVDQSGASTFDAMNETLAVTSSHASVVTNESHAYHDGHARDLGILKSIVYGGLTESITSLRIVSSAAGAGATTLHIVGLALANLIGGLFMIGHKLIGLRNDTSGGKSNETDRYQELLGRRENFVLHAVIAGLSFLIFGLVAPLTYASLFCVTDNREYKLSVVAAASLVCITLLAIGKNHVRKPPMTYIKTVLCYVFIWITSSVFTYFTRNLLDKLLEQLGWFESSLVVTMPLPETRPNQLGSWASY